MRSFLIYLVCLLAFAGGVVIAVAGAGHSLELVQYWNTGSVLYRALPSAPSAGATGDSAGWTPPAKPPAHEHWTWHMSDNKTYEDVVITQIDSREVTITHSLGVAHLTLDSLPADVQQELGYTPGASSVASPAADGQLPK